MPRESRKPETWLRLTCVVCLKPFQSLGRKTRWCSKDCRTNERTMRKTLSSTAAGQRAELALARLEVMVLEFNEAHPECAIKLVAA